MALVGGGTGGASNTVNPAGTGTTLNYIGKHAYAYSGAVDVKENEVSLLVFTTGNEYIFGKLQNASATLTGNNHSLKVKMNDEIIIDQDMNNVYEELTGAQEWQLIIPPYTKVNITLQNIQSTDTAQFNAIFTGRVYA